MKYSRLLLFLAALLVQPVAAQPTATFLAQGEQTIHRLSAELWARPRSGARVVAMPAVREAVRALLVAPTGSRLVIRYPGGEEGSLWAEELRVWLVSLGVETPLMDLRPGSSEADQIELLVEQE